MIKVTPKFNELKVDMNYETGAVNSPNNCRIVTKGSELDLMYQQVYEDYQKVQRWKEKTKKVNQRLEEYDIMFGNQQRGRYYDATINNDTIWYRSNH